MIAGACLAVVRLVESSMSEIVRSEQGRQIHPEHREVEYSQRLADIDAAAAFLADMTTMSSDREGDFDLYCEGKVRANVERTKSPWYAVVPVKGFRDRPDSPWYRPTELEE